MSKMFYSSIQKRFLRLCNRSKSLGGIYKTQKGRIEIREITSVIGRENARLENATFSFTKIAVVDGCILRSLQPRLPGSS